MTIRPGDQWGEIVPAPSDIPRFSSTRALGEALEARGMRNDPFRCSLHAPQVYQLLGIDSPSPTRSLRVSFDVFQVNATTEDGSRMYIAVDSVVVGNSLLRGEWLMMTNTGFWRKRRIATRAHPNDGLVDVVAVDRCMSIQQRVLARHRMRWGTHLPHPQLSVKQIATASWSGPPQVVHIDGVRLRSITAIQVTVVPDALVLYL